MPDVLTAYPHAKVEVTPHGLLLKPSAAAVPKTAVAGMRLVDSHPPSTKQRGSAMNHAELVEKVAEATEMPKAVPRARDFRRNDQTDYWS